MELKQYYQSMPIEKDTIKFRFVKFQLWNGKWIVFNKPSVNRLRRLLVKHNPKNAYISVQKYLNYKEHNQTYKEVQIGKEEVIDIDGQKFKDVKEVWAEASKIMSCLRSKEVQINDFIVTNSSVGGYQIVINNPDEKLINDLSNGFNIDTKVFNDKKRVRRLVWSYNGNRSSFSYRAGMPKLADDNSIRENETRHKTKLRTENCTNLPKHYAIRQVSSSVQGTRGLYVPVFRFHKMPSQKRIRKLQERYKTGSLFIQKFMEKHYLIGFKCHQRERITKMYKFMKCDYSLNEFTKFKQNFIPLSGIDLDTKQKIDSVPVIHHSISVNDVKGDYSRGHLFVGCYSPNQAIAKCIGEEQPVYTVVFRREE